MNASQKKMAGYTLGGIVVLVLIVFLGRQALRETPPEPTTAQTESVKPEPRRRVPPISHSAELPVETPASQAEALAVTNAATLYRQAFALYDALPENEKELLRDWRTNVDASVETEL
jgi:hypothetical protein